MLWLIGVTVFVWLRKPGIDAGEAIGLLKEKVTGVMSQQDLLKQRLDAAPTHGDIHKMLESLGALKGEVMALRESQTQSQRVLQMINEYMHRNKGG